MKEGTNNDIEVLLRRLARKEHSATAPGGEESPACDHLDADELNAFAENSLPDKARAFYSDHLAECERCRKMVTRLTLASGALAGQRESSPSNKSIGAKFLGALSSLVKFRYAVPTLAALAILVVAVVVIRREPQGEFVAQLNSDSQVAAPATQRSEQAPTSQDASAGSKQGLTSETDKRNKSADAAPSGGAGEERPAKPADAVAENSPRELAKLEEKEQPKIADEPSFAPAPAAAAPPKSGSDDRNAATSSEVAQKKNERVDKASPVEDQSTRKEERKKPEAAATAGAPARDTGGATIANRSFGRLRTANEKAKDDDETRSVSGRRFRRDGNSWIDTAYESGAATITIRRGSEQYRALIADEPGIGTIADRLDGEVIVVWKGRAYRIR